MKLMPATSDKDFQIPVGAFQSIVGAEFVFNDTATISAFAKDETEDLFFAPDLVIKPKTTAEIAAIMKVCNNHKIPVTPRGAGTGLSGGALPRFGGIVLSTERLNSIIEIDSQNLQVTTEPGVITEVLQNAVKEVALLAEILPKTAAAPKP